jgi:hypothetical protein
MHSWTVGRLSRSSACPSISWDRKCELNSSQPDRKHERKRRRRKRRSRREHKSTIQYYNQ